MAAVAERLQLRPFVYHHLALLIHNLPIVVESKLRVELSVSLLFTLFGEIRGNEEGAQDGGRLCFGAMWWLLTP